MIPPFWITRSEEKLIIFPPLIHHMPEKKYTLSRFERIFIKMLKIYVKKHKEDSFKIFFDDFEQPVIGSSKSIIEVRFKDSKNTFNRIFTEGSLGLGEVYCEGKIQVKDEEYKSFLLAFVRCIHDKSLLPILSPLDIIAILKAKFTTPFHSKDDQHANINTHYSLGDWFDNEEDANTFYLYWLNSKYIQYSCAKWDEDTKTLEDAQKNKFEFYAKRFGITKESKGKTLLDLGCGWGGFMFYMAENYGLKCKGLTLSTAQKEYIEKEIKRRKLDDNVGVELKNIHDMRGKWDYVVSIGVLEHIDDYDDLYKKTSESLNTNGLSLFHSMFHTGRVYRSDPFLTKYIFPGGGTPNLKENIKIFEKYFKHVDENELPALSYPKTLDVWYASFCKHEDEIRLLLKNKSKCEDVEYAIRVFKHYLMLASCGLTVGGVVGNILAYN